MAGARFRLFAETGFRSKDAPGTDVSTGRKPTDVGTTLVVTEDIVVVTVDSVVVVSVVVSMVVDVSVVVAVKLEVGAVDVVVMIVMTIEVDAGGVTVVVTVLVNVQEVKRVDHLVCGTRGGFETIEV